MPPGTGVCHQGGNVCQLLCCQVAPGTAKVVPCATAGRQLLLLLLVAWSAADSWCPVSLAWCRCNSLLLCGLLVASGRRLLGIALLLLALLLAVVVRFRQHLASRRGMSLSLNACQLQLWYKAGPRAGLGGLAGVLQVHTSQATECGAACGSRGDAHAGQVRGIGRQLPAAVHAAACCKGLQVLPAEGVLLGCSGHGAGCCRRNVLLLLLRLPLLLYMCVTTLLLLRLVLTSRYVCMLPALLLQLACSVRLVCFTGLGHW